MEAKDYEDGQLVLAHGRLHRVDQQSNVLGAREKYEEHEVRFLCGGCAEEWEVRKVQDDA